MENLQRFINVASFWMEALLRDAHTSSWFISWEESQDMTQKDKQNEKMHLKKTLTHDKMIWENLQFWSKDIPKIYEQ